MNTKYHIQVNSQSGSRTIVWEKVAGNDFKALGHSSGVFYTTHFDAFCSTPDLFCFYLNVMSDTPYLYMITIEDMKLESGAVLVLHFMDGMTYQLKCSEVWDGYTAVFPLNKAILDILSEKEIDKYTLQGSQNSFTGDMSCIANHLVKRINQYDKRKGAGLFREYVQDFVKIIENEFGLDLRVFESPIIDDDIKNHSDPSNNYNRLRFKGVELGHDLASTVIELEKIGFVLAPNFTERMAFLSGPFAYEKNCTLLVFESDNHRVEKISVSGDITSSWFVLKNKYLKYKKALSNKYGEPSVIEEFEPPFYEGRGNEIEALEEGKCLYTSTFQVEGQGKIVTGITSSSVFLIYELEELTLEDMIKSLEYALSRDMDDTASEDL